SSIFEYHPEFYTPQNEQYVISRFAYCHREDSTFFWRSALGKSIVSIKETFSAVVLYSLLQPHNKFELSQKLDVPIDLISAFLTLCCSAKLLVSVEAVEPLSLTQWEFHDLLFHSLSRQGRQPHPVGKSLRFKGIIEPPPPIKPALTSHPIPLEKPEVNNNPSFFTVLEARKSIRTPGPVPLTAKQLGEFLYRCARVREITDRGYMQCSNRPYPSGGACYELEIYPVIEDCQGLERGIYHYCPLHHHLAPISCRDEQIDRLMRDATNANGDDVCPNVLLVITARFARVSWAYESMGYSLILKHVGVLYQTMYLVATAMNLAPCALGAGNPDHFVEATGTNYYEESSVGEFMLSSLAIV
ncbi:MAG: SagB/ThcOx family dehydrogenase, partial [Symploca sp. SIO2E9]|nr:SagB/ThcOx family dehydrogenase [Symploca sp. SIO2E9]